MHAIRRLSSVARSSRSSISASLSFRNAAGLGRLALIPSTRRPIIFDDCAKPPGLSASASNYAKVSVCGKTSWPATAININANNSSNFALFSTFVAPDDSAKPSGGLSLPEAVKLFDGVCEKYKADESASAKDAVKIAQHANYSLLAELAESEARSKDISRLSEDLARIVEVLDEPETRNEIVSTGHKKLTEKVAELMLSNKELFVSNKALSADVTRFAMMLNESEACNNNNALFVSNEKHSEEVAKLKLSHNELSEKVAEHEKHILALLESVKTHKGFDATVRICGALLYFCAHFEEKKWYTFLSEVRSFSFILDASKTDSVLRARLSEYDWEMLAALNAEVTALGFPGPLVIDPKSDSLKNLPDRFDVHSDQLVFLMLSTKYVG